MEGYSNFCSSLKMVYSKPKHVGEMQYIYIYIYIYIYAFSWYIWGVFYWNAQNGKLQSNSAVQCFTCKGNTGHGPGACKFVTDSIFILYSRADTAEKQFCLTVETQ